MRVVLEPAYVLHRRAYRNTSLLLEVFSREHGRVGLVARGVRSPASGRTPRARLKALLEPFTPLLLSWSGRGELPTLGAAEEAGPLYPLPSERLISGLYVNELLLRLVARLDPHPGLFGAYRDLLHALVAAEQQEAALRVFEKRLLAELGYGLLLDRDSGGLPVDPRRSYAYIPDRGPDSGTRQGGPIVSGHSLLALHHETLSTARQLREIKGLTRAAIAVQLEGRPLRTRELAAVYRRQRAADNTAPAD